jgi:hypothetical protein
MKSDDPLSRHRPVDGIPFWSAPAGDFVHAAPPPIPSIESLQKRGLICLALQRLAHEAWGTASRRKTGRDGRSWRFRKEVRENLVAWALNRGAVRHFRAHPARRNAGCAFMQGTSPYGE